MKILMVVYDNDSYISWFSQGLAYLASAARNAGHQVCVYQQDIYHWPDSHLTNYLDEAGSYTRTKPRELIQNIDEIA